MTGHFVVANRHVVDKAAWKAFLDEVGGHPGAFGDDITEPMAAPQDVTDVFVQAWAEASEHADCPAWCDDCDQWEAPMSCVPCHGSGCGPGTATGAYDPCDYCAGDGRNHEPYTPTGTWRHKPHTPTNQTETDAEEAPHDE